MGAGKSALLDSLLGEMQRAGGRVAVTRGRGVGLVKQEPWLQQGTVRDNILWGKAYQFSWYTKVVEAFEVFDHENNKTVDVREVGTSVPYCTVLYCTVLYRWAPSCAASATAPASRSCRR